MRFVLQDLSFAFRQFARHRVYAATAILSLALGIGATTSVFSVLYGVLLDPFPYRDPAHMADIVTRSKDGGKQNAAFSLADMQLLRSAEAITDVTAYHLTGRLLTGGQFPKSIHVAESAGNLFQFLGAPALLAGTTPRLRRLLVSLRPTLPWSATASGRRRWVGVRQRLEATLKSITSAGR